MITEICRAGYPLEPFEGFTERLDDYVLLTEQVVHNYPQPFVRYPDNHDKKFLGGPLLPIQLEKPVKPQPGEPGTVAVTVPTGKEKPTYKEPQTGPPPKVRIEDLCITYVRPDGNETEAVRDVSLDSSRARRELGWRPRPIDEAIREGRLAPGG